MPNAIKMQEGSLFSFKETGGSALWTAKNTATAHGRLSTQLDLGAPPRPKWHRWTLISKFQTAVVGAFVRPYLVEADSNATTYQDGAVGITDTDLAAETLLIGAAKPLGPLYVHSAVGANVWSGKVQIFARWVSFALWNATSVSLTNTAADHEFLLGTRYDEIQ